MGVVFDYSDKLNGVGVNPRTKAEIEFLLLTQLWKVQGENDGSGNLLYTQLCKTGTLTRDIHVLCPPYCAHKATNPHLFGGNQYYTEWLIVSCKGDSYIVVLHTKKQAGGVCTSDIDHISKKNPTVDTGEKVRKIRPFVKWWLKECKMEAKGDPQPAPANTAQDGQRYPNASASNLDDDNPEANYNWLGDNADDGADEESPYN